MTAGRSLWQPCVRMHCPSEQPDPRRRRRRSEPRGWRSRPRLVALAGLIVVLLAARPARADSDVLSLVRDFYAPGVFLPVGVSFAGTFREPDLDGLALGAEASLVSVEQIGPSGLWFGGYVDALWDTGSGALRHNIGPEIGIAVLGLDVSYFGVVRQGEYRPGFAARGFVTLGVLSAYVRYGRSFADKEAPDFAELGLLAKVPIRLTRDEEPASAPAASAKAVEDP